MAKPNSVRHLDNAVRRVVGNQSFVNVRSIIANAIVASLLPEGVVKGGSSLKIRYGDAVTRYTTDLDAARAVDTERFLDELRSALSLGWEGFTGRVTEDKPAHPEGVPAQYVMKPHLA